MKYKVILYNSGSSSDVDVSANFSFYTKSQAESCSELWVESGTTRYAYMWDGLIWRYYGQP